MKTGMVDIALCIMAAVLPGILLGSMPTHPAGAVRAQLYWGSANRAGATLCATARLAPFTTAPIIAKRTHAPVSDNAQIA